MDESDLEMLQEIRIEALDNIAHVEEVLLRIEQTPESSRSEEVNSILRAVHTVKGTAGFYELHCIVDLAHMMENVLSLVREERIPCRPDLVAAQLTALDKLRTLVDALPDVLELNIQDEIAELQRCVGAPPPAPDVDAELALELPAHLKISDIRAAHRAIASALPVEPVDGIAIHCDRLQEIDGSGIQMLVALVDEIRRMNTALTWVDVPEILRNKAASSGCASVLGIA